MPKGIPPDRCNAGSAWDDDGQSAGKTIQRTNSLTIMIVASCLAAHLCLMIQGISVAALPQSGGGQNDFKSYASFDLDAARIAQGWVALFDSQTLFGWRVESKTEWLIEDRTIKVQRGKLGLLRTAAQFDDFQLELEFRAPQQTNSGIFIRTSPNPSDPVVDCVEVNIAPSSNPFPTGSLVGHLKAQPIQLTNSAWHKMRVEAIGPIIKVWLNDQQVTEFELPDGSPQKGFIGLQHNSGEVSFRNIFVKPLRLEPLLSANQLDNWNQSESRESHFDLKDSVLRMTNGPGQIETQNEYGNFIFQSHVRTHAAGLNSGIFFRCIPGDFMNGYESQIQNQFVRGDRTAPKDAGTGGIFRRQNARQVNADDLNWLAKTIIADGATICVWVNGLQVADWTDERSPDRNPRKGRRLKPGTIILQGHDPTTDISFKQMFARELRPRR